MKSKSILAIILIFFVTVADAQIFSRGRLFRGVSGGCANGQCDRPQVQFQAAQVQYQPAQYQPAQYQPPVQYSAPVQQPVVQYSAPVSTPIVETVSVAEPVSQPLMWVSTVEPVEALQWCDVTEEAVSVQAETTLPLPVSYSPVSSGGSSGSYSAVSSGGSSGSYSTQPAYSSSGWASSGSYGSPVSGGSSGSYSSTYSGGSSGSYASTYSGGSTGNYATASPSYSAPQQSTTVSPVGVFPNTRANWIRHVTNHPEGESVPHGVASNASMSELRRYHANQHAGLQWNANTTVANTYNAPQRRRLFRR